MLLLTAYQLVVVRGRKTKLMNLLFTDGLVYFGFACVTVHLFSMRRTGANVERVRFVVNLPATVFMFMNLNPFMSVLFGFPTTVVSTVSHLYYKAKSMMLTQERS